MHTRITELWLSPAATGWHGYTCRRTNGWLRICTLLCPALLHHHLPCIIIPLQVLDVVGIQSKACLSCELLLHYTSECNGQCVGSHAGLRSATREQARVLPRNKQRRRAGKSADTTWRQPQGSQRPAASACHLGAAVAWPAVCQLQPTICCSSQRGRGRGCGLRAAISRERHRRRGARCCHPRGSGARKACRRPVPAARRSPASPAAAAEAQAGEEEQARPSGPCLSASSLCPRRA